MITKATIGFGAAIAAFFISSSLLTVEAFDINSTQCTANNHKVQVHIILSAAGTADNGAVGESSSYSSDELAKVNETLTTNCPLFTDLKNQVDQLSLTSIATSCKSKSISVVDDRVIVSKEAEMGSTSSNDNVTRLVVFLPMPSSLPESVIQKKSLRNAFDSVGTVPVILLPQNVDESTESTTLRNWKSAFTDVLGYSSEQSDLFVSSFNIVPSSSEKGEGTGGAGEPVWENFDEIFTNLINQACINQGYRRSKSNFELV